MKTLALLFKTGTADGCMVDTLHPERVLEQARTMMADMPEAQARLVVCEVGEREEIVAEWLIARLMQLKASMLEMSSSESLALAEDRIIALRAEYLSLRYSEPTADTLRPPRDEQVTLPEEL